MTTWLSQGQVLRALTRRISIGEIGVGKEHHFRSLIRIIMMLSDDKSVFRGSKKLTARKRLRASDLADHCVLQELPSLADDRPSQQQFVCSPQCQHNFKISMRRKIDHQPDKTIWYTRGLRSRRGGLAVIVSTQRGWIRMMVLPLLADHNTHHLDSRSLLSTECGRTILRDTSDTQPINPILWFAF